MIIRNNDTESGYASFEYPIVGISRGVDQLLNQIDQLAKIRSDLLIIGEGGGWKGVVSKNIFAKSSPTGGNQSIMSGNLLALDHRKL